MRGMKAPLEALQRSGENEREEEIWLSCIMAHWCNAEVLQVQ